MTDRRELREFLLGGLAPADAEALEERMFAEDALYQELEEERSILIEEYVAKSLTAQDAARFERQIRESPELAREIAGLRDLKVLLQRRSRSRTAGFAAATLAWRPLPAALAGCVLLLAVALCVQWRENRRLSTEVARVTHAPPVAPKTIAPPGIAKDAVLFLAAGVVRGPRDIARVQIAPGTGLLELQIEVPAAGGASEGATEAGSAAWSVAVSRNGQPILRSDSVVARSSGSIRYLPVYIPRESLPDGDYAVQIRSPRPAQNGFSRAFRVGH